MKHFDIGNFRKGDINQLYRVFENSHAQLLEYVTGIIGDQNAGSDIVLDCYVTLWNIRQNFESFSTVRGYLFTTAKRACFFELRGQRRSFHVNEDLKKLLAEMAIDMDDTI